MKSVINYKIKNVNLVLIMALKKLGSRNGMRMEQPITTDNDTCPHWSDTTFSMLSAERHHLAAVPEQI